MLAILFLINGFISQIKSSRPSVTSDVRKSSTTSNDDASDVKMSESLEPTTTASRVARFQVGLSSGESVDSLHAIRDDDGSKVASDVSKTSQNDTMPTSTSKRRVTTNRKKRHKVEKEKCSDDDDEEGRNRRYSTPNSSRRQSATQLTIPSYAVIKQDRQFRLRSRKPLEVRSPMNLSCSPVRRNSTCSATENGGIRLYNDALRRRSVDMTKNLASVQNDSDENAAAKKVSFNSTSSQQSGTGGLHRTLSTSVLRIKHRRSFWEKVIG